MRGCKILSDKPSQIAKNGIGVAKRAKGWPDCTGVVEGLKQQGYLSGVAHGTKHF